MDIDIITNIEKLHTTEMGVGRIKRNLSLDTDDVVEWCKTRILTKEAIITRNGKNWYVEVDNCVITVNAYSYTIITAHETIGKCRRIEGNTLGAKATSLRNE